MSVVSMRAAMPGGAVRGASVRGVARGQSIAALSARGVRGAVRARVAAKMLQRRGAVIRRAGEGDTEKSKYTLPTPPPENPPVKTDPFGFGSSTGEAEPEKMVPGFDTAEGGKVGPVGTFFISLLLIVLLGASVFFTSVPRNAIVNFVDLSDDPNAPTQRFK
mmetsp:Transcript_20970/g.33945  ORF Transcript_20970/g.33945 Transcript_20970/m.33945 type:complete len:162 (+) Transcript_20970:176-661(+)